MIPIIQFTFWLCLAASRLVAGSGYTPWTVGKEYIYGMHSLAITDIPDLASQAAGIKFDAELMIQCPCDSSILVKMIQVTARRFHTDVEDAWQLLESTLGNETVVQGKRHLLEPFVIHHRDGTSLVMSEGDPLWVTNMKKAIASKLQVNVAGSEPRSWPSALQNSALRNSVFTIVEDDVTGECETLYEIAALSDGLIRSDSKLNPVADVCIDGTFFQVVKTKNYSKCRRNPIYNVISSSGWKCPPDGSASCAGSHSRSSVSRYIACGNLQQFTLLKLSHQGEWRMHPHRHPSAQLPLRALSISKLVLKSVTQLVLNASESDEPWVSDNLTAALSYASLDAGAVVRMRPQLRRVDKRGRRFRFQQLRRRWLSLTTSAHDDVDTIASLVSDVARLDYQEITRLYEDVQQRRWRRRSTLIRRKLLLDMITAAGSNPAVMFLIDAVVNGQLTEMEAVQAVAALPLFVKTPTPALLDQLFRMLKAMGDSDSTVTVHQMAMQSISQLVYVACVNASQSRIRFPSAVYGQFCARDSPFIRNQLIPYLSNAARRHESIDSQIAALNALADIGHEDVIPVVLSLLRPEAVDRDFLVFNSGRADRATLLRVKSVLCLRKLALDWNNQQVRRILSAIFHDPSEKSRVRIVALALLISAVPPAYWWQKIAVSTWFEPNREVVDFVYTTLHQLATSSLVIDNIQTASDRAQIVLPLAKAVPLNHSFKWIWSLSSQSAAYHQQLGRYLGPCYFHILESAEQWQDFPLSLTHQPDNWDRLDAVGRYTSTEKQPIYDFFQETGDEENDVLAVKWMQLSNDEVTLPDILGLIVTTRMQTHVLTSSVGSFHGDSSQRFNVDFKPTTIAKSVVTMTVDADFIGYSTIAAIDADWTVKTSDHRSAAFEESRPKMSLKPAVRNRVRPFTALRMINETVTVNDFTSAVKEIKGRDS